MTRETWTLFILSYMIGFSLIGAGLDLIFSESVACIWTGVWFLLLTPITLKLKKYYKNKG